jgi:hypothetical protein
MVELTEILVVATAEANQDLIAPGPNPVVGRPARKSALLSINHDMPDAFRG